MVDHDVRRRTPTPPDGGAAGAFVAPLVDPGTGVLGRAGFLRVAGRLRHDAGGAFAMAVATFAAEVPAAAGPALRTVARAGDVPARWSARQLVLLRHPGGPAEATALHAELAAALAPFAPAIDVRLSGPGASTPADLLAPAGAPPDPGR